MLHRMRAAAARARELFRRRARITAEVDEEFSFHLEMETEKLRKQGLSAEEARRRARLAFGGVEGAKEGVRDERWLAWVPRLSLDLRLGARMLAKASASRYGLRDSEFEIFEEWWALSQPARDLHKHNDAAAQAEIEAAFDRLAAIVDDGARYDLLGYRHVSRAPASGR